MNDPVVINLADPGEFFTKAEPFIPKSGGMLYAGKITLPFPANRNKRYNGAPMILGELPVPFSAIPLSGKITIEAQTADLFETESAEGLLETATIKLDAAAVNALYQTGAVRFSIRSDTDLNPEELLIKTDSADEQPDVVCSRIFPGERQDDDDESGELEYLLLPDSQPGDLAYPASANRENEALWHYSYDRNDTPEMDNAPQEQGETVFRIRFFNRSPLKKEIRKLEAEAESLNVSREEKIDYIIEKLKNTALVRNHIDKVYSINIYKPDPEFKTPFVRVDEHNTIDPDLKTLVLVPGTFKRSLVRKGSKWKGSFKYLMEPTGDAPNWFEYVLKHSVIDQIISLEHDSMFHSAEDNIRYYIDHWNTRNLQFNQSVAVMAASRGGLLSKMMAKVGRGKYDSIRSDDFNLNIEKIITVACGYSGYVDPTNHEPVKRRIEILLNIINIVPFGNILTYDWLSSFTADFIARLPGLQIQHAGSDEAKKVFSEDLTNLWCLPLANNHDLADKPIRRFFKKVVLDGILGPQHDFVLSFDSQQMHAPGLLLENFDPIIGNYIHGKGLSEVEIRKKLVPFLDATTAV